MMTRREMLFGATAAAACGAAGSAAAGTMFWMPRDWWLRSGTGAASAPISPLKAPVSVGMTGGRPSPPALRPHGIRFVFDLPDNDSMGVYLCRIKSQTTWVTVSWGDGTPVETLKQNSFAQIPFATHEYTTPGTVELLLDGPITSVNYGQPAGLGLLPFIVHDNGIKFAHMRELSIRLDTVFSSCFNFDYTPNLVIDDVYLYGTPSTITSDRAYRGYKVGRIHIPVGTLAAYSAKTPSVADKFIEDIVL